MTDGQAVWITAFCDTNFFYWLMEIDTATTYCIVICISTGLSYIPEEHFSKIY